MQLVLAAATAELAEFEPVRRILLVLGRHVIALFALRTLQNNIISRHKSSSFRVTRLRVIFVTKESRLKA